MRNLSWQELLAQYEVLSDSRDFYLASIKSLVSFLDSVSSAFLDRELMMMWMKSKMGRCTLEEIFIRLLSLKRFLAYLEQQSLCAPGLLLSLQKDSTLLLEMKGPRRYCGSVSQVNERWQKILEEFEQALQGLTPLHIARHLRVASETVVRLEKSEKTSFDYDMFLEWLDEKLPRYKLYSLLLHITLLERFCTFLVRKGLSPTNPVTLWRSTHQGRPDALERRRRGQPPNLRPPRFQSAISSYIIAFIDYKRSLSRKYDPTPVLRSLDRYLKEHNMETLTAIDKKCLLDFQGTFSHCKASTRKSVLGWLREFFHFLERRGDIDVSQNPTRTLPRVEHCSHIPHIFTLKEIAEILEELNHAPQQLHHMDSMGLFTVVHFLYSCGLRISEAVKLRVQDVNFEERTIFIYRTKFSKDRLIPVGSRTAEYLERYWHTRQERFTTPSGDDPFFIHAVGTPFSRHYVELKFREACTRAGVRMISGKTPTPHHLRHTFAVHRLYKWYQEGVNPQEKLVLLSLFMGHVKPDYTQHYLHLSADLLRIAGRPAEKLFEEWLEEKRGHSDDA